MDIISSNLTIERQRPKKILDRKMNKIPIKKKRVSAVYNISRSNHNIWNKSSLHVLEKKNIVNLLDITEFYVNFLAPSIVPTNIHIGDKIFSMSTIPGRERSMILSHNRIDKETDSIVNFNKQSYTQNEETCSVEVIFVNDDIDQKSERDLSIIRRSDSLTLSCKNEAMVNSCRFFNMFNNYKFSDLFIILRSGEILYLHKFVLAAWKCDDDAFKESQYYTSIEDDIVIKTFKHLYSDGQLPIDDIIDSDDCISLCQKFGIDHELLKRYPPKNSLQLSNNNFQTYFNNSRFNNDLRRCDINSFMDKINDDRVYKAKIFHSTPHCPILKTNISSLMIKTAPENDCSDKDLFGSFSQDISISMNISRENSLLPNLQRNDESLTMPEKGMMPIINVEGNVLTNYKSKEVPLIVDDLEDPQIEIPHPPKKSLFNPVNFDYQENLQTERPFYSPTKTFESVTFDYQENPQLETHYYSPTRSSFNPVNFNNNEDLLTESHYYSPKKISFNSITLNEQENQPAERRYYNPKKSPIHSIIFDDPPTPLPLFKRLNLQLNNIDIRPEDNIINKLVKVPSLPQQTVPSLYATSTSSIGDHMISSNRNTQNRSENDNKVLAGFKSDEELKAATKPKMRKSFSDCGQQRQSQKRRSTEKSKQLNTGAGPKIKKTKIDKKTMKFETPPKQEIAFNPFTPMPDYDNMPTSELEIYRQKYGLKKNLPKKTIIYLKECHRRTHRVDDGEDSSGSDEIDDTDMVPISQQITEDNGDEETFDVKKFEHLYHFLKVNYFHEILIYKTVNVVRILEDLKGANVKQNLKDLYDYLDYQCISYKKIDDLPKTKYNKPKKTKKFVV